MTQQPFYTQVTCRRDITGPNFNKGRMTFAWRDNLRWLPSESYFRLRVKLSREAAGLGQMSLIDQTGLNLFLPHGLFQTQQIYCEGQMIDDINNYVHQIGNLRERQRNTASWLKGIGKDIILAQPDVNDRINLTADDGILSDKIEAGRPGDELSDISIAAATGIVTGVGTTFETDFNVGDILQVRGVANPGTFHVAEIRDDLDMTVSPLPLVAINNEIDWIRIRNKPSKRVSEIELIYRPALGVFGIKEWMCGNYEISMNPVVGEQFQKYAVESLFGDKIPVTDFEFEVVDMIFYKRTDHSIIKNGTKKYAFAKIRCQSQTITTNTFTDKTLTINPKAYQISVAYQDQEAGVNTSYSRGKLKIRENIELNLDRLVVLFQGQNLPNPDMNPVNTNLKDFTTQNYYENMIYSKQNWKPDIEDLQTWKDYGAYYTYRFMNVSEEERIQVSQSFTSLTDSNGIVLRPQLLLFDYTRSYITMDVVDGKVTKINSSPMAN